jgi:flagellar biosynthetic protein FliQ
MNVDDILFLGERAMMITLLVSAPMLIAGMAVGLVISVLQSVTQIQEMTLTFVPKIIAVMAAFIVFLPWMTDILTGYIRELFTSFPAMVR